VKPSVVKNTVGKMVLELPFQTVAIASFQK